MTITLTDMDAAMLREFLRNHFHDLQLEVARTDARAFRRELQQQQNVVERLIQQLESPALPAA